MKILSVGIAENEGYETFWVCEEKPQFSSFHRKSAARDFLKHHCIKVQTTRFSNILERYGVPFYLKIDIEGREQMCLNALSPSSLPHFISAESECPTILAGRSTNEGLEVLVRLRDLGYSQFKLIHQITFCSLSRFGSLNFRVDALCRAVLLESWVKKLKGAYRISRYLMARPRLEKKFKREFPVGCSGVWGEHTLGKWMTYAEARRSYVFYRQLHLKNPDVHKHLFWCDWHAKL